MKPTTGRRVQPGDMVDFTNKYGDPLRGVVVEVDGPSADLDLTVWVGVEARLYGALSEGDFILVSPDTDAVRQANLALAREGYKAHLAQFPVWAERFARGEGVGF